VSQAALHTPDRIIVAALKAIDPKLSVAWVDLPGAPPPTGRWAVFYDVPFEGNSEESCALFARQLHVEYLAQGYVVPIAECERQAYEKLQEYNLVCYVVNEDRERSFRPLDQRIVDKVRRMDWLRQNLGLKEFKAILDVKGDAMRRQREREAEGIWDQIRSDARFANMAHDALWGIRPVRSVIVPDNIGAAGA